MDYRDQGNDREPGNSQGRGTQSRDQAMIDLKYSLIVEATADPTFFAFYSPELEGFTGVGHSLEDCVYQARWGMREHVELLWQRGLPVPPENANPTVVVRNQHAEPAAI